MKFYHLRMKSTVYQDKIQKNQQIMRYVKKLLKPKNAGNLFVRTYHRHVLKQRKSIQILNQTLKFYHLQIKATVYQDKIQKINK